MFKTDIQTTREPGNQRSSQRVSWRLSRRGSLTTRQTFEDISRCFHVYMETDFIKNVVEDIFLNQFMRFSQFFLLTLLAKQSSSVVETDSQVSSLKGDIGHRNILDVGHFTRLYETRKNCRIYNHSS